MLITDVLKLKIHTTGMTLIPLGLVTMGGLVNMGLVTMCHSRTGSYAGMLFLREASSTRDEANLTTMGQAASSFS